MTKIITPAGEGLLLAGECSGAFALHFGLLKINRAIIAKERLVTAGWQFVLAALMAFNLERFARGGDVLNRLIVGIAKWKATRGLLSVSSVDPKLGIVTVAPDVEAGDSPIARIPSGNKLAAMITGHSTREVLSTGAGNDFVAFLGRSKLNSSTNSSTDAFYASSVKRKSFVINDARVAELADAPDLGSGAERRAGSSPVPGTPEVDAVVNNTDTDPIG